MLLALVVFALAGTAFPAEPRPHAPTQEIPPDSTKIEGSPPGFTTIDGKKNPEKIPDYAVWNSVFTNLQTLEPGFLRTQLRLPADEEAFLYAEAKRQADRDAVCWKRAHGIVETMPAKVWNQAMKDLNVWCRQQDLDAADALLVKLSEDSRRKLLAFVDSKRKTITIYSDPTWADIFGLPR